MSLTVSRSLPTPRVGDGSGITPLPGAHERRRETVGPDLQLFGRARAERVGDRQQHAAAFRLEPLRELRDRCRLARAVDAENEHDRRRLNGARQGG